MIVYGVIYGDKKTDFIPYLNELKDKAWRFENNAMIDISENYLKEVDSNEYVGVLSWKFTQKTGLSKKAVEVICDSVDVDVINLSRWKSKLHFMNWSNDGHKGIIDMIKKCCNHVGLNYNNDPKNIIFANQFVCRNYIYQDYINSVIIPCLDLLEGEMWSEVNKPSGYTAGIELQKLKEFTGLEFYNYIPFILERMFMQYCENKKLNVYDV
jgi:hypothetical protein